MARTPSRPSRKFNKPTAAASPNAPRVPKSVVPRRAALRMVEDVTQEQKLLSESMALAKLPAEDRARAQRLASDTLRHYSRADAVLRGFLDKVPVGTVGNILRIATVELCAGGAAHGVVNDWVEICARGQRTKGLKGLVNAVLRKVAADEGARWGKARAQMPEWLRAPLVEAWGEQAVLGMEAAHEAGAPVDLSLRDGAAERPEGTLLPTGSFRLSAPGQISALPGFDAGAWWVQDAAAALPARILAPQPNEQVVDFCAAPGGKTLQLAASGARVTAVDDSQSRLKRLRENLERTGLKARVICKDMLDYEARADAILLDAPCSATGTMRRHPDLPYAKDGAEFAGLIALQERILDHAIGLLNPGGRLVFCTCSLLPDEGEVQIEAALERHSGVRVDRDALDQPGIDPAWITEEGGLRLRPDYWPEHGGMDGFYMACLRRD